MILEKEGFKICRCTFDFKMRILLFLFVIASFILPGQAQMNVMNQYCNSVSKEDLKKYLSAIASDEFEGRETGTEGQRKAASYIEAQFKAIGLSGISAKHFLQEYPLYQDSLLSTELRIGKTVGINGKDYLFPLMNNERGKLKSKKIVFAGYGIDDVNFSDYKTIDVHGKIVLIFMGEPFKGSTYLVSATNLSSPWSGRDQISKKLAAAAVNGAVGVLFINQGNEEFSERSIGNSRSTNVYYPNSSLRHAFISPAFAKKILNNKVEYDIYQNLALTNQSFEGKYFTEKIKIKSALDFTRHIINASNVIGSIEGTDKKDEYVIVSAHYDHLGSRNGSVYYGADDDGSGTCSVLEIAKVFAKAKADGFGPRRTMIFMTFSGEEKGLWGSEYYSDHPLRALDKTSMDLNIDMVGRIDTERKTDDTLNYVYVVGHDKLSSDLQAMIESANEKSSQLTLDYKYDSPMDRNRIYFRSDHYNFARKGVPVLFFYDGMLKSDYHKPTDTIDKIYWELYEKRVRMIFSAAWAVANREQMMKRDLPLNTMGVR